MNIENLSNNQKGILFIAIGIVLFLSQVGPFRQSLHLLVLLASIFFIIYGLVLGNYLKKIKSTFSQLKK